MPFVFCSLSVFLCVVYIQTTKKKQNTQHQPKKKKKTSKIICPVLSYNYWLFQFKLLSWVQQSKYMRETLQSKAITPAKEQVKSEQASGEILRRTHRLTSKVRWSVLFTKKKLENSFREFPNHAHLMWYGDSETKIVQKQNYKNYILFFYRDLSPKKKMGPKLIFYEISSNLFARNEIKIQCSRRCICLLFSSKLTRKKHRHPIGNLFRHF